MKTAATVERRLVGQVVVRFVMGVIVMGGIFFVTAGTFAYWEAWLYMVVLFTPVALTGAYFLRRDPGLLERRMHMKEKESAQRPIIALAGVAMTLTFVLPGLDHRWGWSSVPVAVVLVADALVLAGYAIVGRTFKENSWASRIIEVAQGQEVITTGPYRLVRHPMYVGVLLMYLASPVALGSWWAVIPALLLVPAMMMRATAEEATLERDLPGYVEYEQVTRYRLVPRLW